MRNKKNEREWEAILQEEFPKYEDKRADLNAKKTVTTPKNDNTSEQLTHHNDAAATGTPDRRESACGAPPAMSCRKTLDCGLHQRPSSAAVGSRWS